ncbi:MAG: hypothetical protein ACAI25_00550, partial [Planctomycetota bacterium]
MRNTKLVAALFLIGASLIASSSLVALAEDGLPLPRATGRPTYSELAAAYAPTIYQDIDDSKHHGRPDVPIRLDFDGNARGDDNWNNFDAVADGDRSGNLGANIYWSVTETATHYYINYSLFFPQDWDDSGGVGRWLTETFGDDPEHENDLETLLVVVEKTPTDRLGKIVLLETQAHNVFHVYGDSSVVGNGSKEVEGPILLDGRHPRIFVESKGHGIYADHETLRTGNFPGGDGIVLRPGTARDPFADGEINGKKETTYGLRSTESEMLPLAFAATGDGNPSANPGTYEGTRFRSNREIAFSIQGKEHKQNAANYPWGQDDGDDGVARGDWFFDPALAVTTHVRLPGTPSLTYTNNVFLDAVTRTPTTPTVPAPAPGSPSSCEGFLRRLGPR